MNNVIYAGTVVPERESPDGETAHVIYATDEANGYALWESSYDGGTVCIEYRYLWTRDACIEAAVYLTRKLKAKAARRAA